MDPEIKQSIKRLFIKFLMFQLVIYIVALMLSVVFTAYFKQRLGDQLSAASRDSILSGDTRQTIITLTSSMSHDFSGMSWRPTGAEKGFSVPIDAEKCNRLLYASANVRLYFDEERRFSSGAMLFYYSRLMPVIWATIAWLIIALLSLPIAYFERRRLIRDYNLLLDLRIKESYSNLAAQVAHDIRSPLAALRTAATGFEIPAEQRALMNGAVTRMNTIADDLLRKYRTPSAITVESGKITACALTPLIEEVLAEKRLQYSYRTDVIFELHNSSDELKVLTDPKEFQRLLSNLINNSVEALTGPGAVTVGLSGADGMVSITVKDNGKGIPPEILAKLGRRGETHGKTRGNGLGLYHARISIENWGGVFKIESKPDHGTIVILTLPTFKPAKKRTVILVDDDKLVRMNWEMAAKATRMDLRTYKNAEELTSVLGTLPKDTPFYIDSELGGGVKGEDIAKDLHTRGYDNITMATGYSPERFAHLPWVKASGKEPPFNDT